MSCNRAKYSIFKDYWLADTKENYFVSYAIRGPLMGPKMELSVNQEREFIPCGEMCGI